MHPPRVALSWAALVVAGALLATGCFGGGSGSGSLSGRVDECVPYDDDCEVGTYCQYADGRTQCVPEGTVARDEACGGGDCQRGSICLQGSQFDTQPSCQQPCTLHDGGTYPCDITRHTCFPARDDAGNELAFGVCRYVQ